MSYISERWKEKNQRNIWWVMISYILEGWREEPEKYKKLASSKYYSIYDDRVDIKEREVWKKFNRFYYPDNQD